MKLTMNKKYEILGRFRDTDGTEKFVYSVDGKIVEITWIKNKKNIAVFCLPTHHYCSLGCKFCHLTDSQGIDKKMIPISSVDLFAILSQVVKKYIRAPKILLSFMGVGEPFLNLNLILDLYKTIRTKGFINQRGKKIKNAGLALATMMINLSPLKNLAQKIKTEHLPIKIHFSLHSPFDKQRFSIIPAARVSIKEALETLDEYRKNFLLNKRALADLAIYHKHFWPTEIHYTFIKDINDGEKEFAEIIKIGQQYRIPFKILKFNPTKYLKRSRRENLWFKKLKKEYGAGVVRYSPPGPNIGSSCGQFTKHYYLGSHSPRELKEFKKWEKTYRINI